MYLYGFVIVKVGLNDETSSCNSQTGNKTKLLKHVRAGQQCKRHTPIGFSGKYAIKFALAVQNKKIIIIWIIIIIWRSGQSLLWTTTMVHDYCGSWYYRVFQKYLIQYNLCMYIHTYIHTVFWSKICTVKLEAS